MKFESGSKRLRLYILCLAAFLLFVALVLPRHKSCYEITSPQLRKVVCGTLSQYANANLYRVDGMAYEEIPAGWTLRGKVIVYKATYCPLLLLLRSFPEGVSKSNLLVLTVYFGKGKRTETDRYYYWVMKGTTQLMRTEYNGQGDMSVTLKHLFEEYKGN